MLVRFMPHGLIILSVISLASEQTTRRPSFETATHIRSRTRQLKALGLGRQACDKAWRGGVGGTKGARERIQERGGEGMEAARSAHRGEAERKMSKKDVTHRVELSIISDLQGRAEHRHHEAHGEWLGRRSSTTPDKGGDDASLLPPFPLPHNAPLCPAPHCRRVLF